MSIERHNVYLDKAKNSLKAAKAAYDIGCYDDSISRYYYSVFHRINYIVKTFDAPFAPPKNKGSHEITILAFVNLLGQIDNAEISCEIKGYVLYIAKLKEQRHKADYWRTINNIHSFNNNFLPDFTYADKLVEKVISAIEKGEKR